MLFGRWYTQQPPSIQKDVGRLLDNGQMEIVNGGLVPTDATLASLDLLLANLDEGWRVRNATLGMKDVTVAWQGGSKAHTRFSPSLHSAFGLTHLLLSDISEDIKASLKANHSLEFQWLGADLKGVYTHILYDGYKFPDFLHPQNTGNCWKHGKSASCARQLVTYAKEICAYYPSHNSVLIPYGDDYFWADSSDPMRVLQRTEAIMEVINRNYSTHSVHIQWGTVSDYFRSFSSSYRLKTYLSDFQPYMSHYITQEYWTGLYSLQSNFKRNTHEAGDILRLASILTAFVRNESISLPGILVNIHETVLAGLQTRELIDSYGEILKTGVDKAVDYVKDAVFGLLMEESSEGSGFPVPYRPLFLYNHLNWDVETIYRFESRDLSLRIVDFKGESVQCEAVPVPNTGNYSVYFKAKLPGLSVSVWGVVQDCKDCVPLMHLKQDENRQISFNNSWEIHFQNNGKVNYLHHPKLGEIDIKQDFLTLKSARIDPYIFLPNYVSYTSAVWEFPLDFQSFHIYSGSFLTLIQTIWLYKSQIMSQLISIPRHDSDVLTWEITSFALENEDLFLSFACETSVRSIDIYDGFTWKSHKWEAPGSNYNLGRNFYPLNGALRVNNSLIIIPKTPLGAGIIPEAYIFHLHRSRKHGDFGVTLTQFTLTTGENWPKTYYEAKRFNGFLGLKRDGKMVTGQPLDFDVTQEKWNRETAKRVKIESKEAFLASVGKKEGQILMRFRPFGRDFSEVISEGVEVRKENSDVDIGEVFCLTDCAKDRQIESSEVFLRSFLTHFSDKVLYKWDTKNISEPEISQEIPPNILPISTFLPTEETSSELNVNIDIARLEYSLVICMSVVSLVALGCCLRKRKQRID